MSSHAYRFLRQLNRSGPEFCEGLFVNLSRFNPHRNFKLFRLEMPSVRQVEKIFPTIERNWREGILMRAVIGGSRLRDLDPFLLLGHGIMHPPSGFRDHPMRGLESVTYVLTGSLLHEDCSASGTEEIKAGDVEILTVGNGTVRCEMPGPQGTEALYFWINLKSENKTIPASSHVLRKKHIPVTKKTGAAITVIAGESHGAKAKSHARAPVMILDVTLNPGKSLTQPIPSGWNALFYVLTGVVTVGDDKKEAESHYVVVFKPEGDDVQLSNTSDAQARFILLAGQPVNEPVVRHGPFVMNTQKEILQTIRDFVSKENGFEKAKGWTSQHVRSSTGT